MRRSNGYTLVICEKPDAARRVAEALSEGGGKSTMVEGTTVFSFTREGEDYVVCAAQGHVYSVSDPSDERTVYPVFDLEWYPSNLVDEGSTSAARRISAIRRLAEGASKFVNACDFDVEGETIGFNLLRYACGNREESARRAKFSTLAETDLRMAFERLLPQSQHGLARAGRARHEIDFVWGVNLSRALSQSALVSGHRYRTVSAGRVQGPTLAFLVQREEEIRSFVPLPYWKISGLFEKDGGEFSASYVPEKIPTMSLAEKVVADCTGKEAVASDVRKKTVVVGPPVPFNLGDLQKEAYRAFGFTPSLTLQTAERLYLAALISYPRTGSQRLPPSIGYRRIISGLGKMRDYTKAALEILGGEPRPVQGAKLDPAHPAIHPTGETPKKPLDRREASLFDLVIRRFLSAFGPPARRELVDVRLKVGDDRWFATSSGRTVDPGWTDYYGRHSRYRDVELPPISEGERFRVAKIKAEEKFEQGPYRYSQSSLLEKMESEGIGTKATRADVISTLVARGYVSEESMEVTSLGFAVAEALERYAPQVLSAGLTREIEGGLAAMEDENGGEAPVLRQTVRAIAQQLEELGANEEAVGREIDSAAMGTLARSLVLGRCPVCRTGELRVVRSKSTKKRFVGCSNYSGGCRASAPLPQEGTIRPASKECRRCGWPIVHVISNRRLAKPWRLCVNRACPGKKK